MCCRQKTAMEFKADYRVASEALYHPTSALNPDFQRHDDYARREAANAIPYSPFLRQRLAPAFSPVTGVRDQPEDYRWF